MLIKFLCNCFIFILILILILVMIIIIFIFIFFIAMIIDNIYIIIMETIFMNTENSKTNESHRFKLDLADKLNLKNPKKHGFSYFKYL